MADIKRVALVTGGNRGLGFETCRQLAQRGLKVILTSRDGLSGKAAADKLQTEGLNVAYYPLDVTRSESILRLSEEIERHYKRLDVLVNNAGVMGESTGAAVDQDLASVRAELEVNTLGAFGVCRMAVPLMQRHNYGRIVNVSSNLAQLSRMGPGYAGYRMSKAALNALTCVLAAELKQDNILVNSVSPGWARTRMGGANAPLSPAEAVEGIVWAATLSPDGPTGGFFENKQPLEW